MFPMNTTVDPALAMRLMDTSVIPIDGAYNTSFKRIQKLIWVGLDK